MRPYVVARDLVLLVNSYCQFNIKRIARNSNSVGGQGDSKSPRYARACRVCGYFITGLINNLRSLFYYHERKGLGRVSHFFAIAVQGHVSRLDSRYV